MRSNPKFMRRVSGMRTLNQMHANAHRDAMLSQRGARSDCSTWELPLRRSAFAASCDGPMLSTTRIRGWVSLQSQLPLLATVDLRRWTVLLAAWAGTSCREVDVQQWNLDGEG